MDNQILEYQCTVRINFLSQMHIIRHRQCNHRHFLDTKHKEIHNLCNLKFLDRKRVPQDRTSEYRLNFQLSYNLLCMLYNSSMMVLYIHYKIHDSQYILGV